MKEVRDEHYNVVGYQVDHGDGIVEHKDEHFDTVGYTIDQDAQFDAAMKRFEETATADCGGPSIEDNGFWAWLMHYGRFWIIIILPIIHLLLGHGIGLAMSSFILLVILKYIAPFFWMWMDELWGPLGVFMQIIIAGTYGSLFLEIIWPNIMR